MKLTKIASLVTATLSCAVLTQCTSMPTMVVPPPKSSPYADKYPQTRDHQTHLDYFINGEFGRPDNLVGKEVTIASMPRARMDDGIDNYASERVIDRFRWLEQVDTIDVAYTSDPIYGSNKFDARERNVMGSKLEDATKGGQIFDGRTRTALQTPDPNPPKSEVSEWVEKQHQMAIDHLHASPLYEQYAKSIDERWWLQGSTKKKYFEGLGELEHLRDKYGVVKVILTDPYGQKREILNERTIAEGRRPTTRFGGNNQHSTDGMPVWSKKGSYIAYSLADQSADDDDYNFYVMNVRTGEIVTTMDEVASSNVKWIDDQRFYYIKNMRLYLHDVTKKPLHDPLIIDLDDIDMRVDEIIDLYDKGDEKNRYIALKVGLSIPDTIIKDLKTGDMYRLGDPIYFKEDNTIFGRSYSTAATLVDFNPDTMKAYVISTEKSEKGDIIEVDVKNPKKRRVVAATPERFDFIEQAIYHDEGNGYFVAVYGKDVAHHVVLLDKNGNVLRDITPLPFGAIQGELSSHVVGKDDKEKDEDDDGITVSRFDKVNYIGFTFSNPVTNMTKYKYSISEDKMIDERYIDAIFLFDNSEYETKIIKYPSYDGVMIPMSITHKKGIKLDGKNPTMLYAYGGFGVRGDSGFRRDTIPFMEAGGIFAEAYIRGGGEYNRPWHKAAEQKRMVHFNDVNAAADYLAREGYADSDHLGVNGGSNGGLMAGGAMTIAPEKYRVAIPEMAVLDMFRFDTMYRQDYWMSEYGLSWGPRKMYEYIKGYSPYHNVKPGVCYPSTMVIAPQRDDRVWPAHSYKFVAALQQHQACDRPILMYSIPGEGHNPGTLLGFKDRYARTMSFLLQETGVRELPKIDYPSRESFYTQEQLDEKERERLKNEARWQKNTKERNDVRPFAPYGEAKPFAPYGTTK